MVTGGSTLGVVIAGGSIAAGVGAFALSGYLARHLGKPGVNWFLLAICGQALWALSYGVSLFVFHPPLRFALEVLTWIGMVWTGPLFLAFGLAYTGREAVVRSWLFLPVILIPTITTVLLVTSQHHELVWRHFQSDPVLGLAAVSYTFQPWGLLAATVGIVSVGIGVLLLLETIHSYGSLYRREAAAVALSVVPPAVGIFPWLFQVGPIPQVNLAPVFFLAHIALDAYAFVGTNMFETNPATRRAAERTLVDDIRNPIVVLDTERQVVYANDAAREAFDIDSPIGRTYTDVLDVDLDAIDERHVVTTRAGGHARTYALTKSPLHDPAGPVVGYTVLFQDITDERQREQRLAVLNRVIRHNLRNELTTITGYAEAIEAASDDPQIGSWARILETSGNSLLAIGEKAHDFEQVQQSERVFEFVAVDEVLHRSIDGCAERFPEAQIDVHTPEQYELYTDPRVLELVLLTLIEETLLRHETGVPVVNVRLDDGDASDGVTLEVHSNGGGLDIADLGPLQRGTETDLEHASGIGLWIVSWGVTILRGEVSFEQTVNGTIASVWLPRSSPDGA